MHLKKEWKIKMIIIMFFDDFYRPIMLVVIFLIICEAGKRFELGSKLNFKKNILKQSLPLAIQSS